MGGRTWLGPVISLALLAAAIAIPAPDKDKEPEPITEESSQEISTETQQQEPATEEYTITDFVSPGEDIPSTIFDLGTMPAKGSDKTLHLILQLHPGSDRDGGNFGHAPETLHCQAAIYRHLEKLYSEGQLDAIFAEGLFPGEGLEDITQRIGLQYAQKLGYEEDPSELRTFLEDDYNLHNRLFSTKGIADLLFAIAHRDQPIHYEGWEPDSPEVYDQKTVAIKLARQNEEEYFRLMDEVDNGKIPEDDPRFIRLAEIHEKGVEYLYEDATRRTEAAYRFAIERAEEKNFSHFVLLMGSGHLSKAGGGDKLISLLESQEINPEIRPLICSYMDGKLLEGVNVKDIEGIKPLTY